MYGAYQYFQMTVKKRGMESCRGVMFAKKKEKKNVRAINMSYWY